MNQLFSFLSLMFFFPLPNPNVDIYDSNLRFYDSDSGRFINPDPVAPTIEGKDLNRYSYVRNNPIKFVDPSGNIPVVPSGGIVGQDPDESGQSINKAVVAGQAGQMLMLTAREVMRAQSAQFLTSTSTNQLRPDLIVLTDLANRGEFSLSIPQSSIPSDLTKRVAPYWPLLGEQFPPRGIEVAYDVRFYFPQTARASNPTTLSELIFKRIEETHQIGKPGVKKIIHQASKDIGHHAGVTATPITIPSNNTSDTLPSYALERYKTAALGFGSLGVLGGANAVVGYSQESNPIIRTLGQTSGFLEVIAGAAYATGGYAATGSRGAALMGWGSKLFGVANPMAATTLYFSFLNDMIKNPPDYGQGLDPIDRRMRTQGGGMPSSYYEKKQEAYRKENDIRDNHPYGGATR